MRKECNNCAKDFCHGARGPIAIMLERANNLECFILPKVENFKLVDLVSRVRIINQDNPVIRMLAKY